MEAKYCRIRQVNIQIVSIWNWLVTCIPVYTLSVRWLDFCWETLIRLIDQACSVFLMVFTFRCTDLAWIWAIQTLLHMQTGQHSFECCSVRNMSSSPMTHLPTLYVSLEIQCLYSWAYSPCDMWLTANKTEQNKLSCPAADRIWELKPNTNREPNVLKHSLS